MKTLRTVVVLFFAAVMVSACVGALLGGTIGQEHPTSPRPVAFIICVPNAEVRMDGPGLVVPVGRTDAQGNVTFGFVQSGPDTGGFNLFMTADGYPLYQAGGVTLPDGAHQYIVKGCQPITSPGFQIELPAWGVDRPFAKESGRLHVVDRHFETEDGQPWSWRGSSMFLLFARYLQGEDITPQIQWMEARGINVARVFGSVSWDNLPSYGVTIDYKRPFDRPDFVMRLGSFFDLLADHGIRVEYAVLTYADDMSSMRAQVQTVYDLAASRWNVLPETCNECENNGIDAVEVMRGVDRHGLIGSYGIDPGRHCEAEGAGDPLQWGVCMGKVPTLDYIGAHDLARDLQHSPRNTKDFTQDFAGIYHKPIVADEHVGVVDRDYPGYCYNGDGFASLCSGGGVRTTDCNVILSAASIEHIFGPGFTIHLQAGVEGRAPRDNEPIQKACAEQLTKVWQFIPPVAQLGAYRAPHIGDFPFQWVDSDSLVGHAYCSPVGGQAWCVNPMPKPGWTGFMGQNGYTLADVSPIPFIGRMVR